LLRTGAEGVVDDVPPTTVRTPPGDVGGSALDVHGLSLPVGPVDDPVDYQQRQVSVAVHVPRTDRDGYSEFLQVTVGGVQVRAGHRRSRLRDQRSRVLVDLRQRGGVAAVEPLGEHSGHFLGPIGQFSHDRQTSFRVGRIEVPDTLGGDLCGDRSYSELRVALPMVSDKVLSDRLAQLGEAGVVERDRRPGWPPRVRYALTRSGHRLGPVLQALWDWGAEAP
jgi:DNA-binding transcriptional ArsR family regulator